MDLLDGIHATDARLGLDHASGYDVYYSPDDFDYLDEYHQLDEFDQVDQVVELARVDGYDGSMTHRHQGAPSALRRQRQA
jgi:hypothetical protein